jgi:putative membrane protein
MKKIVLFAACAMAAFGGLAPASQAQSTAEKTGINSTLGRAPKTPDFVREAAVSDMFEIQSSELAARKGDQATKEFATQMITDHQKTSGELKLLASANSAAGALPTTLDKSHQKMLDRLKGLNGIAFNRRYHSDQVSAHKDAVSLFERYANGGDDAGLKGWANTTLPTLRNHLKMAQDLNK